MISHIGETDVLLHFLVETIHRTSGSDFDLSGPAFEPVDGFFFQTCMYIYHCDMLMMCLVLIDLDLIFKVKVL